MQALLQTILDSAGRPLAVFVIVNYIPLLMVLYFYRKDMREAVSVLKEAIAVVQHRGDAP